SQWRNLALPSAHRPFQNVGQHPKLAKGQVVECGDRPPAVARCPRKALSTVVIFHAPEIPKSEQQFALWRGYLLVEFVARCGILHLSPFPFLHSEPWLASTALLLVWHS